MVMIDILSGLQTIVINRERVKGMERAVSQAIGRQCHAFHLDSWLMFE